MDLLKAKLIAPSIALALSVNLYAQDTYTIQEKTLKEALEIISKKSKLPFIVDESLIENKKATNIKDVDNLQKALKQILKNTNLEAIIKNETIILKKKKDKKSDSSNNLGQVEILESLGNNTEGTGSYTIGSMNTATRLNLSIKDTPQSVVVVTNQEIKDKNMQSFRNLTDSVVGFHSPVWDTDRVFISARGFDVDYYQLDGIPTSYNGFYTEQNLIIYDRVEIVKGANGLISGAGNPSASINMVRKHANSKEFTGEVTLKGGSWDTYSGAIDLTIPLTKDGSVRLRIVAQKEKKDSFRDFYEKETDTFYGIIDADLSDQTRLSFGASYIANDTEGSTWSGLPVFFSDGSDTSFSISDSFAPKWSHYDKKITSIFTNFEHYFANDIKLNINYMYDKVVADPKTVAFQGYPDKTTGLGLSPVWGVWNAHNILKTNALDIYTSFPFELGKQSHEILLGTNFMKTDTISYIKPPTSSITAQSIYSWNGNIEEPSYSSDVKSSDDTVKQFGVYAVGRFDLADNLKLITGTRLSNYKYTCREGCDDSYENKNEITPYAGLVYEINENHSAYVSYTNIFKPQDYKDKSGNILDPIKGNSYEIGLKGEYFDKRLKAAIALYRIKQDGVGELDGKQTNRPTENAYKSVDGVTSKGIEFTIKGDITDKWNVNFGISKFSLKDADGNDTDTLTPRTQIALSTKYKFDKLSIGAGITWQDDIYEGVIYPLIGEEKKVNLDDIYLVNLMAKYQVSKNLSFQLNVDNLFDKKYYSNIDYSFAGGGYIFGDPRKTTLTLSYKF